MKPLTNAEQQHAMFGHRALAERIVGGRKSGYELRNAAGAVLQASDTMGVLLRYIEEKRDVVVVRCRDQKVVWPLSSHELSAVDAQESEL